MSQFNLGEKSRMTWLLKFSFFLWLWDRCVRSRCVRSRCVRSRCVRFAMNHKLQSVHMYVGQRIDSFDSFDAFLKIKIIKKSYPSSSFRTSTHVRTYLLYSVYSGTPLYRNTIITYVQYCTYSLATPKCLVLRTLLLPLFSEKRCL